MRSTRNLTKSEQKAYSANLQRLRSAGAVIGVAKAATSESSALRIEQSGDGVLYAGTRGGIAIAICMRFTVLKPGIAIDSWTMTIPGCESANIFLVDPPDGALSYKVFRWLDLESGVVLNDLLFSGRTLPPNQNLCGFIVAQSFSLLPGKFHTGMNIGAQICVADQSGELFTSIVELRVERYVQIAGVHQGTGLFGLEEAANDARIAIEERRLVPGNAGASDASWYRRFESIRTRGETLEGSASLKPTKPTEALDGYLPRIPENFT